jgi:hypothetical protein
MAEVNPDFSKPGHVRQRSGRNLKHAIASKSMIAASCGELIPKIVEDTFVALQS